MAEHESDGYWPLIESAFDAVSIYDGPHQFLSQFRPLPSHMRHLLAAHWFHSEFTNGGFHQFFYNDTGVLAPEAVEGLKAMDLGAMAHVLGQAMSKLGSPYPRDRESRIAIIGENPRDGVSFAALDHELNAWLGDMVLEPGRDVYLDRFGRMADQFAMRYKTDAE